MYQISNPDPLHFQLSLLEKDYDEIRNCIVRFCDNNSAHQPHGLGQLSRTDPADLTLYGERVSELIFTELPRKLRPFQGRQSQDATLGCYLKWCSAEQSCKAANCVFMAGGPEQYYVRKVLRRARKLVKRTLGVLDLEVILDDVGPGPGSTFETSGNKTGLYYKYLDASNLTYTPDSEKFLFDLIWRDDLWRRWFVGYNTQPDPQWCDFERVLNNKLKPIPGNRLTTVPKTSNVDRPICIEPGLTMMLQKGVGSVMRKKLRRAGIHLDEQPTFHRFLVEHHWDRIATIDLSSASDTISYEFVKFMLPLNWFMLLDSLRSERCLLPHGEWYITQKFSSMGNGYTFELETLLFWALARAVADIEKAEVLLSSRPRSLDPRFTGRCTVPVSVFGDDIIVSSGIEVQLSVVLEECGFSVNQSKTFAIDRAFKESCGSFSLFGVGLPVVNLKKIDSWPDVFVICNTLRKQRNALRKIGLINISWKIEELRQLLIARLPVELNRFQGLESDILDGYLHIDDMPPARKSFINGVNRRLKKRSCHLVYNEETVEYQPSSSTKERFYPPLVTLDPSDHYFAWDCLAQTAIDDKISEGDYFGLSIYSLKSGRFSHAQRRGSLRRRVRTVIMTFDESRRIYAQSW